jgi:hypothetical protein
MVVVASVPVMRDIWNIYKYCTVIKIRYFLDRFNPVAGNVDPAAEPRQPSSDHAAVIATSLPARIWRPVPGSLGTAPTQPIRPAGIAHVAQRRQAVSRGRHIGGHLPGRHRIAK